MDKDFYLELFHSDCLPQPLETCIAEHLDYWTVSTPGFDSYWMGNYLELKKPPRLGTLKQWKKQARSDFSNRPGLQKHVLAWFSPDEDAGNPLPGNSVEIEIDFTRMLQMTTPHHHKPPPNVSVGLVNAETWGEVVDLAVSAAEQDIPGHAEYIACRFEAYAATMATGLGHWWAAFHEQRVIASAGLFADPRIGRYQEVLTAPKWRGLGVASSLVSTMAINFRANQPNTKLLIEVEPFSQAERIYRRIGFEPIARHYTVFYDPREGLEK